MNLKMTEKNKWKENGIAKWSWNEKIAEFGSQGDKENTDEKVMQSSKQCLKSELAAWFVVWCD